MTTLEPGASEVFTCDFGFKPRAAALRAKRPAASMTLGFEVLVQLVIAAITTSPWPSESSLPATRTRASGLPPLSSIEGRASSKAALALLSATRSCGRFGPARLGSTVERSSSRVSVNTGSSAPLVRHMPWSLA